MVELSHISRASFYRHQSAAPPGPDPDMNLRDAMQRIALEFPSYGRPRITAELKRRGWQVNHKRVHRILGACPRFNVKKPLFSAERSCVEQMAWW
jgi:putative transposase